MVLDPLDIGALSHSMHGQTANYPRHHADIPRSANSELCHSSHRGSSPAAGLQCLFLPPPQNIHPLTLFEPGMLPVRAKSKIEDYM